MFTCDITSYCNNVTGSQYLLVVHDDEKTSKIIIDVGLDFEKDNINKDNTLITKVDNLDGIIITHAHLDHAGKLPLIYQEGYRGPSFMTNTTRKLLAPLLRNTAMLIGQKAQQTKDKPLYSLGYVNYALNEATAVEYDMPYNINENVEFTFIKNPHIPGSASVFLKLKSQNNQNINNEINIFMTGDFCLTNPFHEDYKIPEYILNEDVHLIIESTYAGKANVIKEHNVFKKNILEGIKRNKKIIIPTLSLGRCQEIMKNLIELQKDIGSFPIYLDGKLAQTYMYKYASLKEVMLPAKEFLNENVVFVNETTREEILKMEKGVFVVTSGNGCYGSAVRYIEQNKNNPNCLIHFTSFLQENSRGRELMNNKRLLAEITNTEEFSKHAHHEDLLKTIYSFKNLKSVLITHGENREIIISSLLNNPLFNKKIKVIDFNSDFVHRIDRYRVCKSINSKLKNR